MADVVSGADIRNDVRPLRILHFFEVIPFVCQYILSDIP